MKGVGSIDLESTLSFYGSDFSTIERSLLFKRVCDVTFTIFLYFFCLLEWSFLRNIDYNQIHFPQKEEWAEMAKGIDNEVNSEKNKENVHALLSLIIDYKY